MYRNIEVRFMNYHHVQMIKHVYGKMLHFKNLCIVQISRQRIRFYQEKVVVEIVIVYQIVVKVEFV